MKVLAIGDTQFQTENITEVELFIDRLENLISTLEIDFIVMLGDLLHTHERIHVLPLNCAYRFVNVLRNKAPTYILVGNHDMGTLTFHTETHWMNGMKLWPNVVIVDKAISKVIGAYTFVFVPYVNNGLFFNSLDTLETDWKTSTCIFAHQEFYGSKMGAVLSINGDIWSNEYPFVVSGHIHSKQRPQENIYYPGSSLQIAFGENDNPIIPYFDFSKGGLEAGLNPTEFNLDLPRKKIIYLDTEKITEFDTSSLPSSVKLKISVSGDNEDFKTFKKTKKYTELIQSGVKVVFKDKKTNIEKKKAELNEALNITDCNSVSFKDVLYQLILNKKDELMLEQYEAVVNNNRVESGDMFIL